MAVVVEERESVVAKRVLRRRVRPRSGLRPTLETGFLVLTVLATFTPAARAIQLLFTPMAALVAIYLLRQSRDRYVRFTILLWFLSPFLRRLADYHGGWRDPSPILLAPLVVSAISVFFLPGFSVFMTRRCLPLSLALVSLIYGWTVGALQNGFRASTVDFLRWLPPILFAIYCLRPDEEGENLTAATERIVVLGLLGISAYAVLQNFFPPPWDLFWLQNANGSSFGSASGDAVRVFGTMNSPGPFAATLAAGILLLMGSKDRLALPAQLVAALALVLTEVRSAWLGLICGLIVAFFCKSRHIRTRGLWLLGAAALGIAVLFTFTAANANLSKRFSTLSNVKQDESFNERLAGAERAIPRALKNPFGGGMGYLDTAFLTNQDSGGTALGNHDNGIFEFLVTLGLAGTLVYLGTVMLVMTRVPLRRAGADRDLLISCLAVCTSYLVQLPSGNTFSNVDGFFFWLAASFMIRKTGLAVASRPKLAISPRVSVERAAKRSVPSPAQNPTLPAPQV